MAGYEIPTIPANQTMRISLGGVAYYLTLIYRDGVEGGWFLDIDDQTRTPLIHGIPLVAGVDLIAQHAHLGINGSLYCKADAGNADQPAYDNLGISFRLYFVG